MVNRKRKITAITLDPRVKREYYRYCRINGKVASRDLEQYMRRKIRARKKR